MPETPSTERWEWIPGYEGIYKISDQGRVYSVRRPNTKGGLLRPRKDKNGYVTVMLYSNGEKINKKIHRLVATVFIPNPNFKPEVNHINGRKSDNRSSNLEWVTPSENIKHAFLAGLKNQFGEKNPHFRGWIIGVNIETGDVIRVAGRAEIEAKGFIQAAVSRCVLGKQKVHKGYTFSLESAL